MMNSPKSWKKLSGRKIYDNQWINVEEHQVINPSGKVSIYGRVHFKNKAIGIVALDEDHNIYLVGQHRYALNEHSWEIPEGGGALHTPPLESAQRELKEETGLIAKAWTLVLRTHLSNSVSDEEGFIFLAQQLEQHEQETEETEADLEIKKIPFQEALAMVDEGKITDSLSIMGIYRVARLLKLL